MLGFTLYRIEFGWEHGGLSSCQWCGGDKSLDDGDGILCHERCWEEFILEAYGNTSKRGAELGDLMRRTVAREGIEGGSDLERFARLIQQTAITRRGRVQFCGMDAGT